MEKDDIRTVSEGSQFFLAQDVLAEEVHTKISTKPHKALAQGSKIMRDLSLSENAVIDRIFL